MDGVGCDLFTNTCLLVFTMYQAMLWYSKYLTHINSFNSHKTPLSRYSIIPIGGEGIIILKWKN